jgi:6-pyruvoyltetrahydropterin/6-carboxytetrahydropterin synthase
MDKFKFLLSREFNFDAAHRIVDYSGKCERMHGHTYMLSVTIRGELKKTEMVLDFAIFKSIVEENIIKKLDHTFLNDMFDNPTTEVIAQWIFNDLSERFKSYECTLYEVSLSEGANNKVTVRYEGCPE